jgi:hypothetical protein
VIRLTGVPFGIALVTATVATLACAQPRAVQSAPPAHFLINVTASESGLELTCANHCAWQRLTFDAKPWHSPVAIDQYGMSSVSVPPPRRAEPFTPFLFTIQRTENDLRFRGVRGTAWTELSFECRDSRCAQAIDEAGMAGAR